MRYKSFDENDLKMLRFLAAPDRVFTKDEIIEDYTHDEMPEYGKHLPDAVVEVLLAKEVSDILKYAYEKNIPVTPRGSGTGLCGGAVTIHGGILLSLVQMNKILEFDEENLTVTIEPGVLLMDLIKECAARDFLYAPDPGEKSATVGGNVMTNAGGMRAIKYGVTRDFVRGMEVVLPNGEVMELGGKIAKNSSGYSLKDLMIGSEGTLGVVTRLILRLLPMPRKTMSLLVPFPTLEECIETVPVILRSKIIPTAVEFLQGEIIELTEKYLGKAFPDKTSDAYLLLTFDGNSSEEIEKIYETVAEICLQQGAIDAFISNTEERQELIWTARGAFLEAIMSSTTEIDECDVVVPRNKIAEFIKYASSLKEKYSLRVLLFGHAGDGNLHIYACRDDLPEEVWEKSCKAVMDDLYEKARALGGQISGEHGVGHAKIEYLEESQGETFMRLMRGIKKAFDEKNILNPGKVCGSLEAMEQHGGGK